MTASMRILMVSEVYPPAIGGIETIGQIMAHRLAARGHQVVVVTRTPCEDGHVDRDEAAQGVRVVRRPGMLALLRLGWWSQVVLCNHLSLRALGPLWLVPRPWFIWVHTWLFPMGGRISRWLKYRALRRARVAAVSRALAEHLPVPCAVLPDTWRADVFQPQPFPRDRDLVFVGRLVSDKGVDLLIAALARMPSQGRRPRLTIIGGGPEEHALHRQVSELGLTDRVTLLGPRPPATVADELSRHEILVVPSRWAEPFGIVVLEGLACGCVPVVSSGGGLPEALGPCGEVFTNGDVAGLVAALQRVLDDAAVRAGHRQRTAEHLRHFTPDTIVARMESWLSGGTIEAPKPAPVNA
jgi:glycosyltransferase involved in cell wall biosynthesis